MRGRAFFALLAALALPLATAGGVEFPGDGFLPGWTRSGAAEVYNPSALYNVIDGGAELFLELGFVDLRIQKYAGQGSEVAIELYRMESTAAALAVYLFKCGRETPLPGVAARHSADRFQLAMVQGDHFVFINSFSGRPELQPVLAELARRLERAIPAGAAVAELDMLPSAGRVPGTERLLRGPYSLQAIYTLGDGDVLLLAGRRFAAAADYEGEVGHTLITVAYEDGPAAGRAFAHLRDRLDPYLRVLELDADELLFQDFQNRFGKVELRGERIDIRVKLALRPAAIQGG